MVASSTSAMHTRSGLPWVFSIPWRAICLSEKLTDTLEGFHITPLYVRRYREVLKEAAARIPS